VALLDTDEQRTLTKWHLRREAGGFDVPKFQMFSIPLAEVDRAIREVAASDNVDLVIVDTPPGLEQQIKVRELLAHADFVLVPTTQSTADIDSAIEFMAIVSALKVKAAFLLSRTLQRWNTYRRGKLRLNRAGSLCPMDVRHLADIDSTHDHGLGINEFSAVKGGEDFEGVWDFVRKELGL
jgi:chromosome partitioning protein